MKVQLIPTDSDPNNNGTPPQDPLDKYSLRPRALKGRQDARPKRQPAPLSKYRRKTANARERSRMREINRAFEALRKAVPSNGAAPQHNACEKLTKITTLRLAMRYISSLSSILKNCDDPPTLPESPCSSVEWSSTFCSDMSSLSPEFSQEFSSDFSTGFSSDFREDTLAPFDSLFSDFSYLERTFS